MSDEEQPANPPPESDTAAVSEIDSTAEPTGEEATEGEMVQAEISAELLASISASPRSEAPPIAPSGEKRRYALLRELSVQVEPPLTQPLTLAIGPDGCLYTLDRPSPTQFRVVRSSLEGGAGRIVLSFGRGEADHELLDPCGLAIDAQRQIFIPDAQDGSVKKFSADGRWLATLRQAGSDGTTFDNPRDIDVGDDGSICVADTYNNRVVMLKPDGEVEWVCEQFDAPNGEQDEFYEPGSVCVLANGDVIVADTNQNRIVTLDATGQAQSILAASGLFEFPTEVKADGAGLLYIADYGNLRVQRVDRQGRLTGVIDLRSDGDVGLTGGGDIELDEGGHVVMIDPQREVVLVLDFVDP